MNPFKYGCVVAGENYCRRPELQRQLGELVKRGQIVVVQGPRRMGKTSLVVETVKSLRGWSRAFRLGFAGADAPSSNRACGFPAHGFPCETGVIGISRSEEHTSELQSRI